MCIELLRTIGIEWLTIRTMEFDKCIMEIDLRLFDRCEWRKCRNFVWNVAMCTLHINTYCESATQFIIILASRVNVSIYISE